MININNIFKNLTYKYVSEEIAVKFDGYYLTYPSEVINFFNNNSHFTFHTNFALIINKERIGATYILKYYVPELLEPFNEIINRATINNKFYENKFIEFIQEKYKKIAYYKTIKKQIYERYFGTPFYKSEASKFFNNIKDYINSISKGINEIIHLKIDFYTSTTAEFYFENELTSKIKNTPYVVYFKRKIMKKFDLSDDGFAYKGSNGKLCVFSITLPTNNFSMINSDEIKQYIKI